MFKMLDLMADKRRAEIKERFEAATLGPWYEDGYGDMVWAKNPYGKGQMRVLDVRGWGHLTGRGDGGCAMVDEQAMAIQHANAQFAAHARVDLPDLYAENARLRAEIGEMARQSNVNHDQSIDVLREVDRLRAELEAAKRDIEVTLMSGYATCKLCRNAKCVNRNGTEDCNPIWRGLPANTPTTHSEGVANE